MLTKQPNVDVKAFAVANVEIAAGKGRLARRDGAGVFAGGGAGKVGFIGKIAVSKIERKPAGGKAFGLARALPAYLSVGIAAVLPATVVLLNDDHTANTNRVDSGFVAAVGLGNGCDSKHA